MEIRKLEWRHGIVLINGEEFSKFFVFVNFCEFFLIFYFLKYKMSEASPELEDLRNQIADLRKELGEKVSKSKLTICMENLGENLFKKIGSRVDDYCIFVLCANVCTVSSGKTH